MCRMVCDGASPRRLWCGCAQEWGPDCCRNRCQVLGCGCPGGCGAAGTYPRLYAPGGLHRCEFGSQWSAARGLALSTCGGNQAGEWLTSCASRTLAPEPCSRAALHPHSGRVVSVSDVGMYEMRVTTEVGFEHSSKSSVQKRQLTNFRMGRQQPVVPQLPHWNGLNCLYGCVT